MRQSIFLPGPRKRPLDSQFQINLRVVLTAIASHPGGTAADAVRDTGLSASTVSRLVEELLRQRLILEGEPIRGRRGQPGRRLSLNSHGANSVGCQITPQAAYMFHRSLTGQTLGEAAFAVEGMDLMHLANAVHDGLSRLLGAQSDMVQQRFVGLGIAFPVDYSGTNIGSDATWGPEALQRELERRSPVAVSTYTTGAAGAWAELALTPVPRPADYLYLFLDPHLQSSLLLDGRPWTAPERRQGALGRTMVRVGDAGARLYDVLNGPWRSSLEPAAPMSSGTLDQMAGALADGVQPVVEALGLPLVIVDGPQPGDVLDSLVDAMRSKLNERAWRQATQVRRGRAGSHAPALGAALRPIYVRLFADDPH